MKIEFKSSFLRDIKKISDKSVKQDIVKCILSLESAQNLKEIKNLRKLEGYNDYYRIRIKNYRIGIKKVDDTLFLVIIDHRSSFYKLFP